MKPFRKYVIISNCGHAYTRNKCGFADNLKRLENFKGVLDNIQ